MNLLTENIQINTHIENTQPKCYNIIKEAYISSRSNKIFHEHCLTWQKKGG